MNTPIRGCRVSGYDDFSKPGILNLNLVLIGGLGFMRAMEVVLPFRSPHCRHPLRALQMRIHTRRAVLQVRMCSDTEKGPLQQVRTAKDAVDVGLSLFSKGRIKDALQQFDVALSMKPNSEEAQAAYFNIACCHAAREEHEKASEALRTALRDHGLKFYRILNDPDLASFRSTPQFKALQNEARKGGEDVGSSYRRDLKLITEVQAPFRAVRKFFYVALGVAAGISTVITFPRFLVALQGGDDAPSVFETGQNLAINIVGIAAFVALFVWDSRKEEKQMAQITRNETLSRLPIRLGTGRVVEVIQLRGISRPVIFAGSKETVRRTIEKAERYRKDLLKRGVLLIPLEWNKKDDSYKKKGFGRLQKPSSSLSSDDFQKRAEDIAYKAVVEGEKRFIAEVLSQRAWESWIVELEEAEKVEPGDEVYIVLRLDGRIRKSGRGMPDWQELVNDLPVLDALLSKLER